MATVTFTSDRSWIIPADNSSVTIRCYGGQGGDGSGDSSSSGSDGGYAEGELSVSAGEQIEIVIGGGGNGKSASAGFGTSVSAGNGGDAASVRRSPGGVGDIAILAGGGGGGAGAAYGGGDGESETTGSGSGGGNGGDGGGTSGIFSISGADGGSSGGFDGGDGSRSTNGTNGSAAAVGGGGGGGLNGGEGGNATAGWSYSTDFLVAHAGGGAGGDGYTGGVSNSSQNGGAHSGSAKVEIDYTPTPNAPTMLPELIDHQAGNATIRWDIEDSIVDGYYVYRTSSPNPSPDPGNRIATINDRFTTEYVDTNISRGDRYYYIVSAFEATSGNESDATNQEGATVGEVVYVYTNGSWTYYPVYDSELISGADFDLASEISVFEQNTDTFGEGAFGGDTFGPSAGGAWREIENE